MEENQDQTLDELAPSEEASDTPSSEMNLTEEEPQQEEQPLDQKERSRLGRRLSKFEEKFGQIENTMTRLERLLMEREEKVHEPVFTPQEDELDDPDRILTVKDLREMRIKEAKREQQKVAQYQNDYIKTIKGLYTEDPENHALIEKELLTNVNEYPTWSNRNDARADAVANYWKARSKVIEGKVKNPSPNVRGGTNPPMGVTAQNRQQQTPANRVKLDDVSSKFARAMGMDDDYVQKVLGNER